MAASRTTWSAWAPADHFANQAIPGRAVVMHLIDIWRVVDGMAVEHWDELDGQAFFAQLTGAGDPHPQQHVLQLWATAHGLIALQVVGRVDVDPAALHALLDNALTDCLTRVLPTTTTTKPTRTRARQQP